MRLVWDDVKNEWLKIHRGVSFEVICDKITNNDVIDVFANPSPRYPRQGVFVLRINDYTWVAPFIDNDDTVKLITAFPSRRAHKKYGGSV